jgi:hypothetical protein
VLTPSSTTDAVVAFSQNPATSFGSTTGQSVPGATNNGLVRITEPCYTLETTVSPANAGTISVSPPFNCEGNKYTAATIVQLTADASTGYSFSTWSGDVTGNNNPVSVTLDKNKSVVATFITREQPLFLPHLRRAALTIALINNQGNNVV